MSEFDEELRKLAKTRPADVSAIGVARLVKHIEEQEARAEAAERRIVKLEIALRKIADQVDRKYGPLPTSGAKRLALEALKEEVEG